MADIFSGFVPGGMQTTTSLAPFGGGQPLNLSLPPMGQLPDFNAILQMRMQMAQARAEDEARMRALEMEGQKQRLAAHRQAMQQASEEGHALRQRRNQGETDRLRAQYQGELDQPFQSRHEEARLRLAEAASRPMPKKLITGGPGIIPGFAPDTENLPIALLPGRAGFERGGLSPEDEGLPQRKRSLQIQNDLESQRADMLRQFRQSAPRGGF